MRAVLHLTLVADAGAHHLGKTVDIKALKTQTRLNLLTHTLCPRLSTKGTHTQFQVFLADTQLIHCLCQIQGVGRRASQTCDTQVANQLQMLLGITRTSRNTRGTDVLYTIVGTQAARKQSIAVSYGEDIITCHTVCGQTACHTLAPYTDILAGITHDGRVTGCTAGGVNTDNLALRSCLQAKGIVVPEVLLGGKGQLCNVLYCLNIIRTDIQFLQLIAIKWHVVVNIFHNLMQAFALQRAHLVATHTLFVRVPNHFFFLLFRLLSHAKV